MKKLLIPALTLLSACNGLLKQGSVQDFIPGTYVRAIRQEFAIGGDTLVISLMAGTVYLILKKSGYQRILNGKRQPYEHHDLQWTAIYDEKAGLLYEQRYGKVLSFDPKMGCLFVGGTKYRKIK